MLQTMLLSVTREGTRAVYPQLQSGLVTEIVEIRGKGWKEQKAQSLRDSCIWIRKTLNGRFADNQLADRTFCWIWRRI